MVVRARPPWRRFGENWQHLKMSGFVCGIHLGLHILCACAWQWRVKRAMCACMHTFIHLDFTISVSVVGLLGKTCLSNDSTGER